MNINRNQTLDLNVPLSDAFGGTMNLFQESTFDSSSAWTLNTGSVTIDNGATGGIGGAPAGTAHIAGGAFTQIGGTINVVDADGTLQIDAPFNMSGGSFLNGGTVIFNGVTNITTAAGYDPSTLDSKTIINANFTVNDAAGNFDWDGNGASDTTVNNGALMSITANQVDTTDNVFGGTITLNDGSDLSVNVAATSWAISGSMIKNDADTSTVSGDDLNITGAVVVNNGTLSLPRTFIAAGSSFTVNGTLVVGSASQLSGPVSLTGTGTFRTEGGSTTNADTTVNVATFDWDGSTITDTHSINAGVTLTINSPNFGTADPMDDNISLLGAGSQLIVNGPAVWNMRGTINANTSGLGTATIGGTSRMVLGGGICVLNIDGNTIASAPVTFAVGSTTAIDNARTLRLTGGNTTNNTNTLTGGTINGLGTLAADTGKALTGFGTIGANIDFDGASNLFAQNGTLTINGSVLDVNQIGASSGGVLNVVNPWTSSVASQVVISGGELTGGTLTTANPSQVVGSGLVSARVINNYSVTANTGTLIFQTPGNDNDWDGSGAGALRASGIGSTLELRDNATFGFTGTVEANTNGRVFTNGFALDFNPGSNLNLNAGTYESTSSTDLGGTVQVGANGGAIIVEINRFLTFESSSSTTLNGDLTLHNNNIGIDAGATFSGPGALIVAENSHLVTDPSIGIGVLLDNQGTLRPAGFFTPGRLDLIDYQQADTGRLVVDLAGTSLNQFDRLVVTGSVLLAGELEVRAINGFVPALGNTFNLISAISVTGTFDLVSDFNLPAGLTVQVNYLPSVVQLQIVNALLDGDLNGDGFVGIADLNIVLGNWNQNVTQGDLLLGDPSDDGFVGIADLNIVLGNWNAGTPPSANAVPEPATLGLLALGCAAVMKRRV
ncbi:MAG: PEP-CTERM sorting domain-containing protein [Phycisphaerales bacterium]